MRPITLRDRSTLSDRFRVPLADLAALLLSEATRDLALDPLPIQPPLAPFEGSRLARPLVVVPILRAAPGMAKTILWLLPEASAGQIGLARNEVTCRTHGKLLLPPIHPTRVGRRAARRSHAGHRPQACASVAALK